MYMYVYMRENFSHIYLKMYLSILFVSNDLTDLLAITPPETKKTPLFNNIYYSHVKNM